MSALGVAGDSDDWAITRCRELRESREDLACSVIMRGRFPKFRCGVRRADGSIEWPPPKGEPEHVGMDGKPCQCTKHGRAKARRGCAPTCFCHGVKHSKCPNAHPCIGRCGRLTTSGETSACGYCAHCAADRRWKPVEFEPIDFVERGWNSGRG